MRKTSLRVTPDEPIFAALAAGEITLDVARGTIEAPAIGLTAEFPLDEFTRQRFLNGWDDIGLTLRHEDDIETYEAKRPDFKPRTR